MYDIKVYHIVTKGVDAVLDMIDGEFFGLLPLILALGKIHDYLWMEIE